MSKEIELEELLNAARKILKESKYIDSDQDIEQIIELIRNSSEANAFLGRKK